MNQYLLSIYQPDGEAPPPHVLEPVMRDVKALRQEMKAAGAWVFAGGLPPRARPPSYGSRTGSFSPQTVRSPKARNTSAGSASSRPPISTPLSNGAPSLPAQRRSQSRFGLSRETAARMSEGAVLPISEIERVFREEYGRGVRRRDRSERERSRARLSSISTRSPHASVRSQILNVDLEVGRSYRE